MSIKIVHAADFHIGASLAHLDTKTANIRSEEIRNSLKNAVDFCKEKDADALLITGDLFDTPKPSRADCEFVRNTLSSLSADIYIICGNHDYMCPESPFVKEGYFSDNVHIFPCYEHSYALPEKNTVFWGKSYSKPTIEPSFEDCVFDESKINIMLLHGDMVPSGSDNIISRETLAALPCNYAAFGHIHAGEIFNTENVRCAYSGTVEGHSFKDSGTTGIIYAEISETETLLTPVDISQRKYIHITIDITEKSENEIIAEAKSQINSNDFFRFELTGEYAEGTVIDTDYIQKELASCTFYTDITDSSYPGYNLDSIEKEESLRGAFLRELREKTSSEEDFARAAKIGLDALIGRIPDLGGAL